MCVKAQVALWIQTALAIDMSRTPARFTQADISRAIRAAKQVGAASVELRPDGSIVVAVSVKSTAELKDTLDQRSPVEL